MDEETSVNCPHCASAATTRRQGRTTLGYRRFNCRSCKRRFNERTGTPFNDLQVPTDVVLFAVLWRLRYKLSFRDVAEMLLQRGVAPHMPNRRRSLRGAILARLLANSFDLSLLLSLADELVADKQTGASI